MEMYWRLAALGNLSDCSNEVLYISSSKDKNNRFPMTSSLIHLPIIH